MNKIFAAAAILLAAFVGGFAQAQPDNRRVIEVSGSAERLVTPDEFTFKVTILERIEKKEKLTIEQQETQLRAELTKIGIDPAKDLSVYDISSNYIPRKRVRDTLGTKDYRLKVRDVNKIAKLIELVDTLNIAKLDLIDTEYSEITRMRRETKMDAIRAAKEKADYLLGAIGQRVGKPVLIQEVPDETPLNRFSNSNETSNTMRISSGILNSRDNDDALSFTQIRLRYVINAKFEIE
ncbi:MAG: SIMPL domain-containing protein [Acidobacteria bacterium]|nr:SIMPL domain-containing protein [Acidobacteriota bacterium]